MLTRSLRQDRFGADVGIMGVRVASLAVACVLTSASNAVCADRNAVERYGTLPAVDGINVKIETLGGSLASKSVYGSTGSLVVPLGGRYGLQIDGAAGDFDNRFFAAGGAHLFWRDPSVGLLGIVANYTRWSKFGGLNATQIGAEGEYYLDRWSLSGAAGVETGNAVSGIVGTTLQSFDIKTRFFDRIDLSYYVSDDLKLSIGHRYTGGKNALALGLERAFGSSQGLTGTLFAEGRIGEERYEGIWGGLRMYFGADRKPLIQRHRQSDPPGLGPDNLATFGNSQDESQSMSSVSASGGGGGLPPPPCCGAI